MVICIRNNYCKDYSFLRDKSNITNVYYYITFYTLCWLPPPQIVITLIGSVLVGFLTEYLAGDNKEATQIQAYLYAFGIAICAYASLVASSFVFHMGWMIAMRVKIILTGAIYQKASTFHFKVLLTLVTLQSTHRCCPWVRLQWDSSQSVMLSTWPPMMFVS